MEEPHATRSKLEARDSRRRDTGDVMDSKRKEHIANDYLCHLEEAKRWMEACLEEELPPSTDLEQALRNGVILAKLSHFYAPDVVPIRKIYDIDEAKYKAKGLHIKHTDNFNLWIRSMEAVHLPKGLHPTTTDCYDRKNMPKVIYCIHALSHHLYKLGKAKSCVQDLTNKTTFTREEIGEMVKALEQYGIQMPHFGKIRGIPANEKGYDEAARQENEKIALKTNLEFTAYSPGQTETCWATVTVTAPFCNPTNHAEIDLVAVIDRSGSMSGSKIKLVQETLDFFVDHLKENDRFSLVSYSSDVTVDIPLTYMTMEKKESAKAAVKALRATGGTALCDGLVKGMQQVTQRSGQKAQVASVLLLTDGQVGPSAKERILDAMRNHLSSCLDLLSLPDPLPVHLQLPPPPHPFAHPPVPGERPAAVIPFEGTVYTFGFGPDHDASLLEAISQAAEGSYCYIDSEEKIPESFADCLGGLLSVVGQNMELSLSCANGCSIVSVHAKNPPQMSDQNTKCVIQLGDLQSEEERDVLLEMSIPATGEEARDCAVVNPKLTYWNVISSRREEVAVGLDLKMQRCQEGVQQANQSVLVQKLRVTTVETLKQAKELASQGELKQARDLFQRDIAAIEKSGLTEHTQIKFLLADLKDVLTSFTSVDSYKEVGSKKLANVLQRYLQQRSQSSAPNAYSTKKKAMLKDAIKSV